MSTRRAVILGGTGGIGSAVARELLDASGRGGDDWQVDVLARQGGPAADALTASGATFTSGDRRDRSVLRDLLRPGADLLVDTVGLTRDDAQQLLPFLDDVGSTVFVSSRSVYADEQGRHANSLDKPVFGGAVTEIQPTVTAGDGDPTSRDGYGAAKVAAEQVLLDHGAPVTVLRPSKVYGVGIGRPREWFVVRRVLDGRERILLADHGRGVDHTTAASGIGSLVRVVADAGPPDPQRRGRLGPDRARDRPDDRRAPGPPVRRGPARRGRARLRRRHAMVVTTAVRPRHHGGTCTGMGTAGVRDRRPPRTRLARRDRPRHPCGRRRAVGRRPLLGAPVRLRSRGRRTRTPLPRPGLTPCSGPRSCSSADAPAWASRRRPRRCTTCSSRRTSGTR
ncbi:NAD-dependent epimerase/dehydratase family protein [Curtobacterium flaccumfaciens]|nr:NAD-dependent epimerase/dehydratase family protein [Curtobacterium flaccumfaciens]